jgi:hypothetical protein
LQNFGPAIDDAPRVTDIPNPAAIAVWAALTEGFRLEPDDLIKQLPPLIPIVIPGLNGTLQPAGCRAVFAALAVWLERTEAGLFANMIAAFERIITGDLPQFPYVGS